MRDVCGNCIRPIAPNHTRCMYCGGVGVKPQVPDEAITCPRCSLGMHKVVEGDVTLDRCGDCGGTWYDRGELEALREREASPAGTEEPPAPRSPVKPAADGIVYLACPRCEGRMMRRNYMRTSGVMVDVCGQHGLFLDPGERERIVSFHAEGGGANDIRAMDDAASLELRKREERRFLKRLGQYSVSEYFSGW